MAGVNYVKSLSCFWKDQVILSSTYLIDYIHIFSNIETLPAPDKTTAWPGCRIL